MERDHKIGYSFNLRETPMYIGGEREKPDETLIGNMMKLIRSSRTKVSKPKLQAPIPEPLPRENTSP